MLSAKRWFASAVLWSLLVSVAAGAEPVEAPVPWPEETPIRIVDEEGRPVDHAAVGLSVSYDNQAGRRLGGFGYMSNGGRRVEATAPETDADGVTRLPTGAIRNRTAVVLVAAGRFAASGPLRDESGRLLGSLPLTVRQARKAAADGEVLQLVVRPAPLLRGQIDVSALTRFVQSPIALDRATVFLRREDGLRVTAMVAPPSFSLRVPPGRYRGSVHVSYADSSTFEIEVSEDAEEADAPPSVLEPLRYLTLIGQAAPELRGIEGWANTEPLALSELRGKVVLLDFWGVWCGPCLHALPEIADLHERYGERGLVIIGIHCADPNRPVTTADELRERLEPLGERFPGARNVTFPVALTRLPDEDGASLPSEDYGVRAYPTTLLIGRDGRLIGRAPTSGGRAAGMIEEALAEDEAPTQQTASPVVAAKPVSTP